MWREGERYGGKKSRVCLHRWPYSITAVEANLGGADVVATVVCLLFTSRRRHMNVSRPSALFCPHLVTDSLLSSLLFFGELAADGFA